MTEKEIEQKAKERYPGYWTATLDNHRTGYIAGYLQALEDVKREWRPCTPKDGNNWSEDISTL